MQVETDVALYEAPDPKMQITARIPRSVRMGMDDVVRLWKMHAEARGDDVDQVDFTFALNRMLKVGIDQAFSDVGGRPVDEAGWKIVERAIKSAVSKSK